MQFPAISHAFNTPVSYLIKGAGWQTNDSTFGKYTYLRFFSQALDDEIESNSVPVH